MVERVLLQAVNQLVELRAGCARVNPGCAALYTRAVKQDAARLDLPLQLDLAPAEGRATQERQAEAVRLVGFAQGGDGRTVVAAALLRSQAQPSVVALVDEGSARMVPPLS